MPLAVASSQTMRPSSGSSLAADQAVALEADDEARHRRRADLLGLRELADGDAPAEHHDRQRRGARRRQPHRIVLAAEAAEEVDRRGVEALGDGAFAAVVDLRYLHMLSMYLA